MKRNSLLLSTLLCSACNFSTVTWTDGTWAVVELASDNSSDECDVLSVFQALDPMTYVFGPKNNNDTGRYFYDTGRGGKDPLLSEEKTQAGLSNLWTLCSTPSYSADIYCPDAVEMLYDDQWLPQVEEILNERHCEDGEVALSYTNSEGGLLSPNEALLNSQFNFRCESDESFACTLRLTSRLRPVD